MTQLRGAVIGCGAVSGFHLRGWERIPEVAIVALCDLNRSRAEARAEKLAPDAHIYDSAEALFAAERLDFADIVAPPGMHKELCLLANSANVHIICQKPLCPDPGEATALVAALGNSGKAFVVHENHRYRPWFRRILDLNANRFFGTIRYVRFGQHDAGEPREEYKTQAPHGVMLEYGVHLVDMMRALLGEPRKVSASFQHLNPRVRGESLAVTTYEYESVTAVIDVAWKAAGPAHGGVIVEGERGTALYEGTMTRGERARLRLFEEGKTTLDASLSPSDEYAESFCFFQREFIDSLLNGSPPPQAAKDNLRSLLATFAAYESAQSRHDICI